ncbi:MAG: hypothetical protein KGI54_13810 [Pseudomonadota bacterium]|nr:hypothetical protein [Pseudomonadota bacterium]
MNDDEARVLAVSIAQTIKDELSAFTLPHEVHAEHHEFIKSFIEREKVKAERWEKIRVQVTGWGIVVVLGAIGTIVYNSLWASLKEHLK